MTDLVGRLRDLVATSTPFKDADPPLSSALMSAAADEIERLRDKCDRLSALRDVDYESMRDETERLRLALKDCADELEAWVNHHYGKTLDYPGEQRRFERDIEFVVTARKLLQAAP